MVGDVHGTGVGVEFAVNRCGVREKSHFGGDRLLVARVIVEGAVG
jgi:hypothetical protein